MVNPSLAPAPPPYEAPAPQFWESPPALAQLMDRRVSGLSAPAQEWLRPAEQLLADDFYTFAYAFGTPNLSAAAAQYYATLSNPHSDPNFLPPTFRKPDTRAAGAELLRGLTPRIPTYPATPEYAAPRANACEFSVWQNPHDLSCFVQGWFRGRFAGDPNYPLYEEAVRHIIHVTYALSAASNRGDLEAPLTAYFDGLSRAQSAIELPPPLRTSGRLPAMLGLLSSVLYSLRGIHRDQFLSLVEREQEQRLNPHHPLP